MKKLLIIILSVFIILSISCLAYTQSLITEKKNIENVISNNNKSINDISTLQDNLHLTAESFRNSNYMDEEFVKLLSSKWLDLDKEKQKFINDNIIQKDRLDNINETLNNSVFKGLFELTAYYQGNITATGTTPKLNHTISVDPSVIPYGSKVLIEGYGTYIAEDCGGAVKGNIIDIYMSSYDECMQFGRRKANVWIIKD